MGTLIVNVSGSFLLGLLFRYALGTSAISLEVRVLLTTGFCGGYTTFSTFSYDSIVLLEEGQSARAGVYVVSSVLLSLAATWLGVIAARALLVARSQS
jgi:CrcB protein